MGKKGKSKGGGGGGGSPTTATDDGESAASLKTKANTLVQDGNHAEA